MELEANGSGNSLPSNDQAGAAGLGDRISAAVAKIGSLVEAGRIAGATDETVARWRREGSKPPFQAVVALCEAAEIRVEWMATGKGPRDMQPTDGLSVTRTDREHVGRALKQGAFLEDTSADAIALPRLSIEGSAGQGLIPSREEIEDYLSVSRTYLREVGINPIAAHVLRLSGHSMAPTLLDKDLVIVDTSQTRIRDEEIYALAYGETVLIKRLRPQWDGSLRIISDNKGGHYEDALVPSTGRDQLRIVGRVGGFLRYI